MRKTLPYILVLAVLAFGVWFLLFRNKNEDFSASEAGFTIKDTGSIGKFFLARDNGEMVKLERKNGRWLLNDHFPALQSRVNMLFRTLMDQQAAFPVPETQHNNVVKGMIGTTIKVEIYDLEGRQMRQFYVGGEANKGGTIMLMNGAKRPYVVKLPDFDGYVTPRYEPELRTWRDRTVFDIPAEHVQEVDVKYAQEPLNSFSITQKAGQLKVTLDTAMMMNDKPLNQRRTLAYLKFFQNINMEEYVNGQSNLDSLLRVMPKLCTVDVSSDGGEHRHLEVYYFPQTKRSKNQMRDRNDMANNYDADRYYGVINDGKDTVSIQNFVFEKIFRRGYEFFTPDPAAPAERPVPVKK